MEHSEVLQVETLRHNSSPSARPLTCAPSLRANRAVSTSTNPPLESIVACPREANPPFDLRHNVGGRVHKAVQVYISDQCYGRDLVCAVLPPLGHFFFSVARCYSRE